MSSPLAKDKKNFLDRMLISFHRNVSHGNRVELLSKLLYKEMRFLKEKDIKESLFFLDVGCGDMTIGNSIAEMDTDIHFKGIDIHQITDDLKNSEKWKNYSCFDGKTIPFADNSFDVVLFSDVLHHDFDNIERLLTEAKRVSKYIVIKDHFEYGFLSRKILQLADIVGNYGYGISIPKKYMSKNSFLKLISACGLKEVRRMCPIHLYDHNLLVKTVFRPKYQFISILK
ncbi:class I SAM-dependent methyltransferase [Maribacter sp. 2-571]|uniref:class I SAM-dependent methyltransferase n=1 Tax=Maribacter sp. 2-571 TaxID=3417569 RepID=UPI003D33B043